MAKKQFSFKSDGPTVELLYSEGKTVSQIAKELGRGYTTIKNYLEYKGIYRGPANMKGEKRSSSVKGTAPDTHVVNEVYWSKYHNTTAKFKGYYNGACKVFLIDPDYYCFAYCKHTDLIKMGKGE